MRGRGSIGGPLVLIAIGILFLIHTLVPDLQVGSILTYDWPYLLIAWGVIQLIEILLRASRGAPVSPNGISGGGWALVLLICFAGLANWEVRRQDTWWRRMGFENGVKMFGQAHDYTVSPLQRSVGATPHLIIESFRGSAKLIGSDGTAMTVNGHKSIQALEAREAERANRLTPVEVLVQGSSVIVRCNQDKAPGQNEVTTNLEIRVPKGASVEGVGRGGDLDITGVNGTIDLSSEGGEMHLQDIGGSVKVETAHCDLIRCVNVKGPVSVRGRGSDVDLSKILGDVTVHGDYNGTVSLKEISRPVRMEGMRTEISVQQLPGEITLARGSLEARNLVGPSKISTHSTDVSLNGFRDVLDLTVDKGDIDLMPGRVPLARMNVRARSGDISLALPDKSAFVLSASTDHGEIQNEFGENLKVHEQDSGARLEGSVESGPELHLSTDRGSVTIRKASAAQGKANSDDDGTSATADDDARKI